MRRSSHEVAMQAVIYGTLGVRASLEVTEPPQYAAICTQLLPWVEGLHVAGQLNEFHREILATPHRELPRESQTEAYWRGEAALLLGWAVQVFDKPDPIRHIAAETLVDRLRLLQPNTNELISDAVFRPVPEIEDYCLFCHAVRNHFQRSSLDHDGQTVLKRIQQRRLAELGLSEALGRQPHIEMDAAQFASENSGAKSLYVVRALASEWLLGVEQ
jgi:hypothetical protein